VCGVAMADHQACGRPVHGTGEPGGFGPVCIMHSSDVSKPEGTFAKEIGALLDGSSTRISDPDVIDLTDFQFPPTFKLPTSWPEKFLILDGATISTEVTIYGLQRGVRARQALFKRRVLFRHAFTSGGCDFCLAESSFGDLLEFSSCAFKGELNLKGARLSRGLRIAASSVEGRCDFSDMSCSERFANGMSFHFSPISRCQGPHLQATSCLAR
jgi:hypothetical protein